MITAPFNFVPLSDKVFFPDWAEKVNHDIPFEDAQSGVIDITITAKSPIFIRDHKDPEKFCNHNGAYYIPGSSVKGMVRNVLEIMSFSKMSFVDDKTYAVRDLRNPDLYRDKFKTDRIYCGWLRKDLDDLVIDDCGHPARISHQEIDKATNTNFSYHFSDGFNGTDNEKLAKYKYSIISEDKLQNYFKYKKKNNVGQEVYHYDEERKGKYGTLVFTGQPTKRENSGRQGDGKGFEFIFFDSENTIDVPKDVFENFKFAYFDGRKTNPKESEDWKYWKEKLFKGERVPVFFRKDNDGRVLDFGLSYLYKLPYNSSVIDGIPNTHKSISDTPDLSQTIFGYINNITKNSLKGRVQFSHFKATNNPTESGKKVLILGTPRASYYPIYIEQSKGDRYKTYMDKNFKISGWKRYPICKNLPTHPNETESKVTTTFYPLRQGAIFEGKLRFHNLKPCEVGALLSALTFHNDKECYHNIGLAKPYGYGKIDVTVNSGVIYHSNKSEKIDSDKIKEYLQTYEKLMCSNIKDWQKSIQLQELFTMATEQQNDKHLKYLSMKPGNNEFEKLKASGRDPIQTKHYLPQYTSLEGIKIKNITLINSGCSYTGGINKSDDIEKDWQIVKESQDESLLILFIKKYSQSDYANDAKKLLSSLNKKTILTKEQKEERAYRAAIAADRFYEYEQFLAKYPNSKYKDEINEKISTLKEKEEKVLFEKEAETQWNRIKESENIDDYENFLKDFPDSKYEKDVRNRINEINIEIEKERKAKENAQKAKKRNADLRGAISENIMSALNKKSKSQKKKKKK